MAENHGGEGRPRSIGRPRPSPIVVVSLAALAGLAALAALVGCGASRPDGQPGTPGQPSSSGDLLLRLTRSGGIANEMLVVELQSSGAYTADRRTGAGGHHAVGTLSPHELDRIRSGLTQVDRLAGMRYVDDAIDAYTFELEYRGRRIEAMDTALPRAPAQLSQLIDDVQRLAR